MDRLADLEESLALSDALAEEYSRKGLAYFLDQIIINSTPEPKRFGGCADPWQRQILAAMIPAIDDLAGLSVGYTGPRNFMQILARGHNKSSLEAWIAAFLLICSKRLIKGYVLAADRDQGKLVLQALEDLIEMNPWVAKHLTVTQNRIEGPAGFIEVLSCDHRSMMGLRGNFYIADEFVHWPTQKPWTSLVTGLAKVRPTVFVAISNAGLLDSWQHASYLNAKASKKWTVFHKPGTLASWLDPVEIENNRLQVPPSEARRLFDNEWIDPAEEHDYLRRPEVEGCSTLGKALGLIYRVRKEYGVGNYVASVDFGPKRDRTALCVGHQNDTSQVVVDKLDVWQGKDRPQNCVTIREVEDWIWNTWEKFHPQVFVIDPHQMLGTIERMQREGLPVEAFKFRGGQGNYEMAQHLRAMIVTKRLIWYENAGLLGTETLESELCGLRVKKMTYGFRFDHENQKHDDRAVALGMMSMMAVGIPATNSVLPKPGLLRPRHYDG